MTEPLPASMLHRFRAAMARRKAWEPLWRDCYAHGLPQRGGQVSGGAAGSLPIDTMFDGTAADAVDQLAASLVAELVPPWSNWLGFHSAPGQDEGEEEALASYYAEAGERTLGQFHRSNFAIELHQCLLDLATVGTATLLFEEEATAGGSAFRFAAMPVDDIYVEADSAGRIRGHFRRHRLTAQDVAARYGTENLPPELARQAANEPDQPVELVESVAAECGVHRYTVFVPDAARRTATVLDTGAFSMSPFITFRWNKSAGECYGRSPVMTALPDIKTANKVVELVLNNASMAVSGMWQLEDDGLLNPSNLHLAPGAVIPKAPGSSGLTPLPTPGRFDVSELVLSDLRGRIRHTMMVDRLGPLNSGRMTATEVLERSAEAARLLGAVYGRLQAELIDPLLQRAVSILVRRGELSPLIADPQVTLIRHHGPLSRVQARDDVQQVLLWVEQTKRLGDAADGIVDAPAVARWLARTLGVPAELIRRDPATQIDPNDVQEALQAVLAPANHRES